MKKNKKKIEEQPSQSKFIHYTLIILGAIWLIEVAAVTYAVVKIIEFVEG